MMFPHLLTGLSREIVIQIPSRSRSRVCFPCQVFLTHRPCACHTRPHAISPWYHPLPKSAVAKHVLACKMNNRDLLLSLFWEFVFFFLGRSGSTIKGGAWGALSTKSRGRENTTDTKRRQQRRLPIFLLRTLKTMKYLCKTTLVIHRGEYNNV